MSAHIAEETGRKASSELETALEVLRQRFGERFSDSPGLRQQHGQQTTWLPVEAPDAVVFPESTEEVAEIVRVCAERSVPVIPYGVGTSLEGHVNAPQGGISIDFNRMNRVVEVHAEDFDCVVQPGITRTQLNSHLRDLGLFFPIDPGADATLGGMAATRASGTNAVRYGTMRDNIISMTAVMADGSVIKTGNRARKSSAGYDLTRLLIGSEGTLGVITELTLKLHGIPEAMSGGFVQFESVRDACDTTMLAIQSGIPVARIELLDPLTIRGCNIHSKLDLPEKPTLFVEFHGSKASVEEQSELFGEICGEFGGGEFQWSTTPEERTKLWQARHDVYWATRALKPGAETLATDVCVPISRLADIVEATRLDIEETGLLAPILGHVGDGNFHVGPLVDPDDHEMRAKVEAFVSRLNHRAIEMEGTCTGEHGVGQGKIAYLHDEFGPALDVMRAVKQALDPKGIMNPGKILGPA